MSTVVQKICCVCGQDVSQAKRTKDAAGNYYCAPCWAEAVRAGAARQAKQTVAPVQTLPPKEANRRDVLTEQRRPAKFGWPMIAGSVVGLLVMGLALYFFVLRGRSQQKNEVVGSVPSVSAQDRGTQNRADAAPSAEQEKMAALQEENEKLRAAQQASAAAAAESARLRTENAKVVPPVAHLQAPTPAANEPSASDFTKFANSFLSAYGQYRKSTAHDSVSKYPEYVEKLQSIDKQSSDSMLHPVVWVLSAKEYLSFSETNMVDSTTTFKFFWDKNRWMAISLTTKDGDSGKEETLGADYFQQIADKCQ